MKGSCPSGPTYRLSSWLLPSRQLCRRFRSRSEHHPGYGCRHDNTHRNERSRQVYRNPFSVGGGEDGVITCRCCWVPICGHVPPRHKARQQRKARDARTDDLLLRWREHDLRLERNRPLGNNFLSNCTTTTVRVRPAPHR